MSLKTRLLVLIVLLVTVIVTLLSAMNLTGLVQSWSAGVLERSELVAQQVKSLVLARTKEQSEAAHPPPANLDESKRLWTKIVAGDPQLEQLVRSTMAHAEMIVEIVVADELGEILVCSNPSRKGGIIRKLPSFAEWKAKEVTDRLLELAGGHQDYEVTLPLGVPQQKLPIFTIQIVVSSVFLRSAILPQVRWLGVISAASLLMSILLGVFSANLAIGPLASISKEIDRIASGAGVAGEKDRDPLGKTRELAIVQSKLNLLGQQIRGAQEDATQMRSNIETLIERMEDAVLLFDRDDKLILAGPAAERLLEAHRQQMMGCKVDEVFPPSDALGGAIQQSIRLGTPARDYLVNFERDGRPPLRLLLNVNPLSDRSGTLITLRDAESRHQVAAQLDVSRRLSAISRLTGGVAHEIKNPLNSIALRLELLRSRFAESPEADDEINVISQEIRRLDRVVKTFLDFTRPVDLTVEDVDLAALAREITALVRPQAAMQQVTIQFSAEPENIPMRADRDLLKQAILNVVVNGIESMRDGGTLSVKALLMADHCLLSVQDEGPGIPEEHQSKVFQLYFTTKEKGSGIGLAMTFRAVQLHNGTIDFTSEPGKGTIFRLRFPFAADAV
ncbi:MAG: PAS domain-containing protein [Acidobacteria bacterium]|nr:PAS domain-containing protein [Acidobacteriota bacterium]